MTIPKTVARFNAHVTNRVSRPFARRWGCSTWATSCRCVPRRRSS